MKHLRQHIRHTVQGLAGTTDSYFFLKYSKASLIIYIIAIIKDPNAIEPI
jgi:hypothetical protein